MATPDHGKAALSLKKKKDFDYLTSSKYYETISLPLHGAISLCYESLVSLYTCCRFTFASQNGIGVLMEHQKHLLASLHFKVSSL